MNVHQHARLTPAGRALLVHRVAVERQAPAVVAQALGVSVRTVYKWRARYRAEGVAGLRDRSSRPHRSPRRVSGWCEQEIARLRRQRWTAPRIARRCGLPVSTVVVVQRRLGLARLGALAPRPPVIRYQRARPGELVHLDMKRLGRIGAVGHRIHGDPSRRSRGVGWEVLHVCVDDATRLAYLEVLPDERATSCDGFLQRASAWLAAQGVRVERVMTDNGSGYRAHAFRATVAALGARQLYTRPYTPRTNGKAERFIQTALREWAYRRAYHSSAARTAALAGFQRYYNTRRSHSAIGQQPPQRRLAQLMNNVPVINT